MNYVSRLVLFIIFLQGCSNRIKSRKNNTQKSKGIAINTVGKNVQGEIMSYLTLQEYFNTARLYKENFIEKNVERSYFKKVFESKNFSEYFLLTNKKTPGKYPFHIFLQESTLNLNSPDSLNKRINEVFFVIKKVNKLYEGHGEFIRKYYRLLKEGLGIQLLDFNAKSRSEIFSLHLDRMKDLKSHRYFLHWALAPRLQYEHNSTNNLGLLGKLIMQSSGRPILSRKECINTEYLLDDLTAGKHKCKITFRSAKESAAYTEGHKPNPHRDHDEDIVHQPIQVLLSMMKMHLHVDQLVEYLHRMPGIYPGFSDDFPCFIFEYLLYGCVYHGRDQENSVPQYLDTLLEVHAKFFKIKKLGKIDEESWMNFVRNIAAELIMRHTRILHLRDHDRDQYIEREIRNEVNKSELVSCFIDAMIKYFELNCHKLLNDTRYDNLDPDIELLETDYEITYPESFPIYKFVRILNVVLKTSIFNKMKVLN